ncbi:hypothetical protein [Pseudomonas sichuanensis]|uniref:Uncharacterized protein n=1 Tax=Pseudomonas sichuanensis TaxID=2213015 RepID=A0ABV0DL36_9PSED
MHEHTPQAGTPAQLPSIRLICLASDRQQLIQYRTWSRALSDPIELVAVDISATVPADELAAPQSLPSLARTLASRLQPFLAHPHAIFAQDEAAHLALALTYLAQRSNPGQTRRLFVSSCDSPEATEGGQTEHLQVPVTAFYPPDTLAAMLGWQRLARQELELVELPAHSLPGDQRLISVLNAHLGLLCFA